MARARDRSKRTVILDQLDSQKDIAATKLHDELLGWPMLRIITPGACFPLSLAFLDAEGHQIRDALLSPVGCHRGCCFVNGGVARLPKTSKIDVIKSRVLSWRSSIRNPGQSSRSPLQIWLSAPPVYKHQ
jgi:hypothetical protein